MEHRNTVDCLVVGAGPAGLTATLYLRRFLRQVVLVDDGHSRAMAIELSHNFPGFPQGISGDGLLVHLREQVTHTQGECVAAEVTTLRRHPAGGFAAEWSGDTRLFRSVLLATGVVDVVPPLPGIDQVRQRGLLRQCPICDGYEHRGQRILVLGDGPHAAREAAFIAHFSPHVAHVGLNVMPLEAQPGVRVLAALATGVEVSKEGGVRVFLGDGQAHDFDVAYAAMRVKPRSELGRAVGAEVNAQGNLVTDADGATGVEGLYAAGDIVPGLDQLVVAAAQGAAAATAMHNLLRQLTP